MKKGRGCCSSIFIIIIAIIIIGGIGSLGKKSNKSTSTGKTTKIAVVDNKENTVVDEETKGGKEESVLSVTELSTDKKDESAKTETAKEKKPKLDSFTVSKENNAIVYSTDNSEQASKTISVAEEWVSSSDSEKSSNDKSKTDGESTEPSSITDVEAQESASVEDQFEQIIRGSSGDDVVVIQRRLAELGFLTYSIDGKFGAGTEQAVKDFQNANELEPSGIVDTATYNVLISSGAKAKEQPTFVSLKRGDAGDYVKEIQAQLVALGFLTSTADGKYGSGTEQAVKDFQNANNLSASGVVDESTYSKMFSPGAKHYVAPIVRTDTDDNSANVGTRNATGESTSDNSSRMVWLSATGEKYHSINNCGRMNPNKARQVTLEQAKSMGYEPCSKCM